MQVNNSMINYYQYVQQPPLNMAQKAMQEGQPENKPSQMSNQAVEGMRTFKMTDSEMSKEFESMRKNLHASLVRDALTTKAAMILKSHEDQGDRAKA